MSESAVPEKSVWPTMPDKSVWPTVPFSALLALFWLTLRQHTRGMRLVLVCLLFLVPSVVVIVARLAPNPAPAAALEEQLILYLMPHVLAPLAALLYGSGMIQDEIEEQTLTYLLVRPLPRWLIYLTKLLATLLVTIVLTGVFTLVTYGVIAWGDEGLARVMPERPLQMAGLFALMLMAYCALFGLISLFLRRSLVAGVVYIAVFEGLLANIDFAFRHLTIMHYFRVLCARWLELKPRDWQLDLATAPSAGNALLILIGASLVAAVFGAVAFAGREFRVKTPEGS
jgi:ABC-2 type transport system permease protein